MTRIALYPGSFDPVTNGHVNIVERGLDLFDEVIIAVAWNPNKTGLFSAEERLEIIREVFDSPRVRATRFEGLLVDFARECQAQAILRGLRSVGDFEYEYQMANMNRQLAPGLQTVFLMAEPDQFYVSSRIVKEVAALGGDIASVVPDAVLRRLQHLHRPKDTP